MSDSQIPTITTPGDVPAGPVVPEYHQPQPDLSPSGRRRFAVTEVFSWVVVLVIVAITATSVAIEQQREKGNADNATQLMISAKYAVGVHSILPTTGTTAQLLGELDDLAKSPQDRFRMAIVAGELSGKEEAIRRLDALDRSAPNLRQDITTARSFYTDDPQQAIGEPYPTTVAPENPVTPAPFARAAASAPPADFPPGTSNLSAFQKKWAWFAELSESFGKPPTDPTRAHMLEQTYWTLAGMLAIIFGGGGGALLGLGLLITVIVLMAKGKLRPAYGTTGNGAPALPFDRRAYIEGFALFAFLFFGSSMILRLLKLPELVGALASLVLMPTSVLVGLFWPRIRGGTWAQWRAAFGLHRGRGLFREVISGIGGYLAGLPIVILGFAVMLVLLKLSDVKPTHPIQGVLEKGGVVVIALVFLAASVWAPVTEELMFRGALFSHLRERFRPLLCGIVVGLLFALVHPQGWPLVPVLGSIGFVLAMIREWRGSIIASMTAHALHNTLTLIFALMIMH